MVTVNARYAFGPWRTWLKSKNPASPREREEEWRYFGARRPSGFCPNGKPDEGEYSQAENDNRNRDHFDGEKLSCHAPSLAAVERQH